MTTPMVLADPAKYGFQTNSLIYTCSTAARREIIQASGRIRGSLTFQMFWDRVLTEAEREDAGGNIDKCYHQCNGHPANLLMKLRNYSPEMAIVEIAYRLNFLTLPNFEWLLSEIGADACPADSPVWDRDSGRLVLGGRQIKTVRVSIATNVVMILDDFQNLSWPRSIADPFTNSDDPQRVYQAVSSLNNRLEQLRFCVRDGHVCWEMTEES